MLNCDECMERLYPYLDRELNEAELRDVQFHLELCPPCQERFQFEENVLRLVGRCGRKLEAPESLVDRVRRLCNQ